MKLVILPNRVIAQEKRRKAKQSEQAGPAALKYQDHAANAVS